MFSAKTPGVIDKVRRFETCAPHIYCKGNTIHRRRTQPRRGFSERDIFWLCGVAWRGKTSRSGKFLLHYVLTRLYFPNGKTHHDLRANRTANPRDAARAGSAARSAGGRAGVGVRFIVELEAGKPTVQLGKALGVLAVLGCKLQIGARSTKPQTRGAANDESAFCLVGQCRRGTLSLNRHGEMRFTYSDAWLADATNLALSVSLPKRPESFSRRECRPFFEGLLPEAAQRDAVAKALGISSGNEFKLLDALGGDVAGALTFWPEGATPVLPDSGVATEPLSDDELVNLLDSCRCVRSLLAIAGSGVTCRRPIQNPCGACE